MKILGIVAEYNPFHYGHLYHLNRSKEIIKPDYVIAIMSGNFTQRGEPALFDKWTRTKMALKNGIDAIIELPISYACQSAELFALGAMQLLDACNIITHISFASESGSLDPIYKIARILANEPAIYKKHLRHFLNKGLSYPNARNNALAYFADDLNMTKKDLNHLLQSPNSILGIEYIKAIIRINSNIDPVTFARKDAQYHDSKLKGKISSATAIRNKLKTTQCHECVRSTLPKSSYDIMTEAISKGRGPVFLDDFEQLILGTLRTMTAKQISEIMDVVEGLENRIKRASQDYDTIDKILENTITRRYVGTRIQRILINTLIRVTTDRIKTFNESVGPRYIRILGFKKDSQILMNKLKRSANLPIITKSTHFQRSDDELLREMFLLDTLSTDLYVLGMKSPNYRQGGLDFKTPPVIL